MAVAFDSGNTVPTLTELSEKILARLAPMRLEPGGEADARGPYARTLRRFPCDPDPRNEYAMDMFRKAIKGLPAALLVIGDGEVDPLGPAASQIHERVDIRFYLASGHAQNPVTGRLEPSALAASDNRLDPGLDAFGQHVIESLAGFEPDIAASATALRFRRRRRFVFLPEFTIECLEFSITVGRPVDVDRPITEVIGEYRATHAAQDGGELVEQERKS